MINEFLNFMLCQSSCVHHHFVMDWKCSGSFRIVVCDHEEIEDSVDVLGSTTTTILFYNCLVNHSTWRWVDYAPVNSLKKSCAYSLIDKDMENLRIIIRCKSFNSALEWAIGSFIFNDELFRGRTTDTVSVDHDQTWPFSSVYIYIFLKCSFEELLKDLLSFLAYRGFLLLLGQILSVFVKVLVDN